MRSKQKLNSEIKHSKGRYCGQCYKLERCVCVCVLIQRETICCLKMDNLKLKLKIVNRRSYSLKERKRQGSVGLEHSGSDPRLCSLKERRYTWKEDFFRNRTRRYGHYITNIEHLLFTNIGLILRYKLYGPLHYTIYVTCVFSKHVFYTHGHLIHLFQNTEVRVMNARVTGQCSHAIHVSGKC